MNCPAIFDFYWDSFSRCCLPFFTNFPSLCRGIENFICGRPGSVPAAASLAGQRGNARRLVCLWSVFWRPVNHRRFGHDCAAASDDVRENMRPIAAVFFACCSVNAWEKRSKNVKEHWQDICFLKNGAGQKIDPNSGKSKYFPIITDVTANLMR